MIGAIDFANAQQNAAYLVGETDLDALDAAAHAEGHLVRRISLAGCRAKDDLLQRIASALTFPATFGANWDALSDCLGDLEWLPNAGGYAWLFDHSDDLRAASEGDFDMLCDVLDDACKRWKDRGSPCFAFLALPDDAFSSRQGSSGFARHSGAAAAFRGGTRDPAFLRVNELQQRHWIPACAGMTRM